MNQDLSKKEAIPYVNQEEAARIRQQKEDLKQIQAEEKEKRLHENIETIARWMRFFGWLTIISIIVGAFIYIGTTQYWW